MHSVGNLRKEDPSKYYRSLTWYLACRAAVIAFLLGGAVIFSLGGNAGPAAAIPLLLLIGLSFAQALFSVFILKKIKNLNVFSQIQIVWDLLFVTVLILLTDGVGSVFTFAYLLVIVSASFLLPRKQTIFAAACATILFGGLLDLQYFHYLHPLGIYRTATTAQFLASVFVHAVAFFLTAILSGTLAERWRYSEAELEKKSIDLSELERMNQTILAHISSGLMMVDLEGKIRSFNRAATEITGFSFEDIYNKSADELFPELNFFSKGKYQQVNRAEAVFFRQPLNEKLILGYATTTAKDGNEEEIGLLVTFQDLTQLKKVEGELQRADRLAAVGRLASGMAHEIRNPLASISGSVQLLLEADSANQEDRKLMGIVVKEAERLSSVLTHFLSFARPKPPEKEKVNVTVILDELVEILSADNRFERVNIEKKYAGQVVIELDRGQIWQVLWDLAINSAEAMHGEGHLSLSAEAEDLSIVVEDSGPGVPENIKQKIFDPFFSTKEKGTGLGLASVYSVVEAHGGNIEVSSGHLGGARLRLSFVSTES